MAIPRRDLVTSLEFLVVVVLHAEGASNLFDHILIGCGVVAPRGFVTDGTGTSPIGVHVTRGQRRAGVGLLVDLVLELGAAAPYRRGGPIHVETGGHTVNVGHGATGTVEVGDAA